MSYLYLPPNLNVLAGRTVTSLTGTPDSEHPVSWLTDQRPAFPMRYPAGAWSVGVSVATQAVRLIALANHSIDAAVTLGGSVTGTITPDAKMENDIYLNPYKLYTSSVAGVTSITLAGTNTGTLRIGEAFAGVPLTLPAFQMADFHDELWDGSDDSLTGEWLNIPKYDKGLEWRVFGGTQAYTTAQRDQILSWRRAQRSVRLPGLIILDQAVNDARVVLIGRPLFKPKDNPAYWEGTLSFLEFPRYRWS